MNEAPITSNTDRRLLYRADGAFRNLDASLNDAQRSWLDEIPLERAVTLLDADPAGSPIRVAKPQLRQMVDELKAQGGEVWVDAHFRMAIALLLVRTLTRSVEYRLPQSVDRALAEERVRIVDGLLSEDTKPYGVPRLGSLLRDVGFCRGTALPFGVGSGRLGSSVAPDLLARAGLGHLRPSPWLNMHLDLRPGYPRVTPEARVQYNELLADFLRVNPAYQGTVSVGWTTDPKSVAISPRLQSPIQESLEAGVVFASLGTASEGTVRQATARSEKRRRLYEEGLYTPTDYVRLWPRDRLIRWVDARRTEA